MAERAPEKEQEQEKPSVSGSEINNFSPTLQDFSDYVKNSKEQNRQDSSNSDNLTNLPKLDGLSNSINNDRSFNPAEKLNPNRDGVVPGPSVGPEKRGTQPSPESSAQINEEKRLSGITDNKAAGPGGCADPNVNGEKYYPQKPDRDILTPNTEKIEKWRPEDLKISIGEFEKALKMREFKKQFEESASSLGLDKSPLGPALKAVSDQLAAGKFDPKALQDVMKNTVIPEADMRKLQVLMKEFNADAKAKFGLTVNFDYSGKGDQVSLGNIKIEHNAGNDISIALNVSRYGQVRAEQTFGDNGPTELKPNYAFDRFQSSVTDRMPLRPSNNFQDKIIDRDGPGSGGKAGPNGSDSGNTEPRFREPKLQKLTEPGIFKPLWRKEPNPYKIID